MATGCQPFMAPKPRPKKRACRPHVAKECPVEDGAESDPWTTSSDPWDGVLVIRGLRDWETVMTLGRLTVLQSTVQEAY